jgi:phosphatidylserine/phosphatidylglycerophosphate/cardiolipin synthase-like enzyme
VRTEDWFLTAAERRNAHSRLAAWSEGNDAEPLIHGAEYFARLATEVEALGEGDHLFFTDWRGDPDERLGPDAPTVSELFSGAARRGVVVKGLMWRSHPDALTYSQQENRHLGHAVEAAGGEVLLDQRVRRGGSHHQKLVVLRHVHEPDRDVAFVGGIDLCHSRRDDARHVGDPQAVPMTEAYGPRPPWHDVQLAVRGPAVGEFDATFRERWEDHHALDAHSPVAWARDLIGRADLTTGRLPPQPANPPTRGTAAVQLLRTYPARRPGYDFAPRGERSVARAYVKAVRRARRIVYLEDQYLWSKEVARLFAAALRACPTLQLVIVVPRHPDVDGRLAQPPNLLGREQAMEACRRAGADRVHVFDVENHDGVPVYVHAKICVVDDVWATVGSDNFNRRSWTHDSELSCAVLDGRRDAREPTDPAGRGDGARVFARELRLRLMREHLDRAPDGTEDADLIDPESAVRALTRSAEDLEAWHARGRNGPRPPGRLRPHNPQRLGIFTRLWADPAYRLVYDPDGRRWRDRVRGAW